MTGDKTYRQLQTIRETRGSGFVLLLDPEKLSPDAIASTVSTAVTAGVDVFFVGGSFLHGEDFDETIRLIKLAAGTCPVIIFPGSLNQISPYADAILFLSLISGRNPEHLIGTQVVAAPLIHRMKLEPISCGYLLIESGKLTSAQFVSNSLPIPRDKPGIAAAHALAGQFLGLKSIYLEAGSGAQQTVPEKMIAVVAASTDVMLFVGGGIRSPEEAAAKAQAGADFVVVGNFFESEDNLLQMRRFAEAIHH